MADKKLTELPLITTPLLGTDEFYAVRDNVSYQLTFADILAGVPGAAVWGSITGTLSNQTDLQTELNDKVPKGAIAGGPSGLTLGTNTLAGRYSPGTGDIEEISCGGNVSIAGGGIYANIDWGMIGGTLTDQTDLQAALDAKISGVAWGVITGTLSDQTDLASALGGKAATGAVVSSGLTMSTGKILGRDTAGTGAIEELAETGSGSVVRATGPTLSAPVLGTPASGNLSNCTALPVGSVTGLGTNVAAFLATPSSANLAAALTDETGTGAAVFADSPAFTTGMTLDAVDLSPQIKQNVQSGTYTLVLSDANKQIVANSGSGAWTIPANSSVAYPIGTTLVFIVIGAIGTRTIAITTDLLVWLPTQGTGSRSLAAGGLATACKIDTTVWVITGVGLT